MIAVCGLDCNQCDIFQATTCPEVARAVAEGFERERGLSVSIDVIHCVGCRGDRSQHWSPACALLRCCVDERGLQSCSECPEFPCRQLAEWATHSSRYAEALVRLEMMRSVAQER